MGMPMGGIGGGGLSDALKGLMGGQAATGGTDSAPPTSPADPYNITDPLAIKQADERLDERWKIANYRRYFFELKWLQNVLYGAGVQHIRIDWATRAITNLKLLANYPRAITNKYAQVNEDLWASLIQGDVPVNFTPATDETKNVASAEVCERLQEVIDFETKSRTLKRDLGFWVTYTGNAFVLPYYDYSDEHGTTDVEMQQCEGCVQAGNAAPFMPGAPDAPDTTQPCPACSDAATALGQSAPMPSYAAAPGADGSPLTGSLPVGKLCHDILSPFEVYKDNTIRAGTMKDRWFFRFRKYDISTARKLWPNAKITEGMTEKFKPSRNYLIAIAFAGSQLSGTGAATSEPSKDELKKQVTAWEYYELPSVEYPKGAFITYLGEEAVSIAPLPNAWGAGRLAGQPFLGLVHFMGKVSGGAWAKAPADDLVRIQARRNIIESNLQLTIQRVGAPKLLNPIGSGLKNLTGEGGQILDYKPWVGGGSAVAKPEYLEGALGTVGATVDVIKMLDDAQERIAGTFFLAGGQAPAGVTAASALAFLGERSNRALAPGKEQWAEGWAEVYQYDLEIIRRHWTDPRILAILGANKEWEYLKFKNADLTGAVNVRIDYEALFPKSQATKRADIMQLSQMGVINPTDSEQNYEVLLSFGATHLKPGVDVARAQAKREWDQFSNDPSYMPAFIPGVQNSPVHLVEHKEDAQTQEFDTLYAGNPGRAQVWINHILAHQADIMAQEAMNAGPGPSGPSAHGAPPQGGHASSQHGSQHGPAGGNAHGEPAPIRKGESAANAGTSPIPEAVPIGQPQLH